MDIYFLRHGETPWNLSHKLQGRTHHTDLTEFGVQLAEMSCEGMRARRLCFDRIYSSPLTRAFHTAEIIASGLGGDVIADDRLLEMSFGPYEGMVFGEGAWPDENLRNLFKNPAAYIPPPGAESVHEVEERVARFLNDELLPLASSCGNILAVSHGGFMRAVLRYISRRDVSLFWDGRQPNCCYHRISVRDGKFFLEEQSSVFYDPALAEKVPSV